MVCPEMNTPLRNSKLQLGSWLQTGSSVVAELADASGFDWLLIDLEHGCGTEANVLPQLQAIRNAAAPRLSPKPHAASAHKIAHVDNSF